MGKTVAQALGWTKVQLKKSTLVKFCPDRRTNLLQIVCKNTDLGACMNYQEARDDVQLRVLDKSIDTFINGLTGHRQTIIFFPGGMASKLLRAKTPYKANSPPPQLSDFKNQ